MIKVNCQSMPNIPWEDRPSDSNKTIWRYTKNPIIPADAIPTSNTIFNSAVVPFENRFAGLFRCDSTTRQSNLHVGFSSDGIKWDISHEPFNLVCSEPEIAAYLCRYDPRICEIDGVFYVTWCNGYYGPTIGVAKTTDFKTFYQMENAFLPANRNGVMFPRKINGNFAMLSRPSDWGHTPFGDIFYSESPDMTFWGKHRHVMGPSSPWESTKTGAGPIPIETEEGWLLIYHGVLTSCNGFTYAFGSAILDIDRPWIVKHRAKPYLMAPVTDYERIGDVPNVLFPCAALCDADTNRLAIYYGCADTVIGLAFSTVDDIVAFTKENSI